ncbi:hypothetical protein H0H92_007298 [Tricholoma furcatifolium]|nr:hypothetical protein H0H92_007298 [Tricholoma furcatifolium]
MVKTPLGMEITGAASEAQGGWVARPGHGAVAEGECERGGEEEHEWSEEQGDVEKGEGRGKGKGTSKEGEQAGRARGNVFLRAGRFQKASNLNYGLALSLKAEHHLLKHQKEVRDAQDVAKREQHTRHSPFDFRGQQAAERHY